VPELPLHHVFLRMGAHKLASLGPQDNTTHAQPSTIVAACSLIVQQPSLAKLSPYALRRLSRGSACGAVVAQDDTQSPPPACVLVPASDGILPKPGPRRCSTLENPMRPTSFKRGSVKGALVECEGPRASSVLTRRPTHDIRYASVETQGTMAHWLKQQWKEQQVQRLHSARATLSGVPPLSHGMFQMCRATALRLDGAPP
jgi:hypothetical protein